MIEIQGGPAMEQQPEDLVRELHLYLYKVLVYWLSLQRQPENMLAPATQEALKLILVKIVGLKESLIEQGYFTEAEFRAVAKVFCIERLSNSNGAQG